MIDHSNKTNKEPIFTSLKSAPSNNWESIGPNTRPQGLSSQIGQGRFISLWVEENNPDYILAGGNNSGLWKTENGGTTWVNCTEGYNVGGVSGIAVDPDDTEIIYIVSRIGANGFFKHTTGNYSMGIFKSLDGGDSWIKLNTGSIPLEYTLRDILLDPINDILYVLSAEDVYKSTDGGSSWVSTQVPISFDEHTCYLNEMIFGSSTNVLCVSGYNALFSTSNINFPAYWEDNMDELNPVYGSNSIISVTSDGDDLFCLYSDKSEKISNKDKVAFSLDDGLSWNHTSSDENLDARHFVTKIWAATDGDLFGGGVDIHMSTDGGKNWGTELESNYFHDDVRDCHFINSHPDYIWAATDGGIFVSHLDGQNWQNITGNIAGTEFYCIDIIENYSEYMIGGAHDCGTYIRNSDEIWTHKHGGDGGRSLLDYNDTTKYFYSVGGIGPVNLYNESGLLHPLIDYNSPVIMHPTNSNIILLCLKVTDPLKYYLLRSNDRGLNFETLENIPNNLIDLSFCSNYPQNFYFATYNDWESGKSRIFKTNNSGNSFDEVSYGGIYYAKDNYPITSVKVNPYNPENVWVSFGALESNQQVFTSLDGGGSWINKSGTGLPNIPVQCIEYDFLNGYIFAGTDMGIYYCSLNELVWSKMSTFPDAIVTSLRLNRKTGELVAATYGRGGYRLSLGGGYCDLGLPIYVSSSQNFNSDTEICSDIIVENGSILTISAEVSMSFNSTITITDGSTLRVDSGYLGNGNIIINNGCKLEILNDGIINCNYDDDINIEEGGTLEILLGEIKTNTSY